MTRIDQIKSLLEKVNLIAWKYRHILQEPQYRFNIFSILRQEDDEVYLHSRFLAELLDPKGGHCQDHALLEAFLQQVGIEGFRGATSCRNPVNGSQMRLLGSAPFRRPQTGSQYTATTVLAAHTLLLDVDRPRAYALLH